MTATPADIFPAAAAPEAIFEKAPTRAQLAPSWDGCLFSIPRVDPLQQRNRITIAERPRSSYLRLVQRMPTLEAATIKAHLYLWRGRRAECLAADCCTVGWAADCAELELHLKTPDLLSSRLDEEQAAADGATSFFYHVELFRRDAASRNLVLCDEATSTAFRTVSHSKQCDNKRRPGGRKPSTKRTKVHAWP